MAKKAAKAVKKVEKSAKSTKVEKADKVSKVEKKGKVKASPEGEPVVEKVEKKDKATLRKEKAAAKKEAEAVAEMDENRQRWADYKAKFGADKAAPYQMSAAFEAQTGIQHKVLGWGYILSNQNDRLEVLFETGVKMLISNYKG